MLTPVTFSSAVDESDLVSVVRLRRRALSLGRHRLILLGLVVEVCLLAALASLGHWLIVAAVAPLLALIAWAVSPMAARVIIGRQARANPFLTESRWVTLTGSGVDIRSESYQMSRPWSAFSSWIDDPAVLVLNLSDRPQGAWVALGCRDADDGTGASVRATLREHLGPPRG